MSYLIVESGKITNIIVADADFAAGVGAKEWYDGAAIGDTYDPPTLDKTNARIAELETQLSTANTTVVSITKQLATTQEALDALALA